MTDINVILNNTKKKKYCMNCGKSGHSNKECNEPITSIGMILFKLDTNRISEILKKKINIEFFVEKFNKFESKKIILNETKNILNTIDNEILDILKEHIYFLIIQRKQTLGYIEFIRGRYDEKNINTILHLVNQMTKEELKNIYDHRNDFDYLWNEICNRTYKDLYLDQEHNNSRDKFILLSNMNILEIICNYEPQYKNPEWGFPKGRRNYRENPINCAKREVMEETNLTEINYNILSGLYPLTEIMTGTNEKKYKHIYYIGVCKYDTPVIVNTENDIQQFEIGNIGWFNYNECNELLREYHIEKKKLLSIIFSFVVGQIMKQDIKYSKYITSSISINTEKNKQIRSKPKTNQLNI
jgi:8-oxo-dGTP pyrophosphatase MutT (NUDIX family)